MLVFALAPLFWTGAVGAASKQCVAQAVYEAKGGTLRVLRNTPVEFPKSSRLLHWVGPDEAHYAITIARDGRVTRAAILRSTDPELGASGLAAVQKWRYEPPSLDGQSVCVDATVTMEWKLSSDIE